MIYLGQVKLDSSSSLDFLFHPKFNQTFDKLDGEKRTRVEKSLNRFKSNPMHYSESYLGSLQGIRKIKVLDDLRILITICRECRANKLQHLHRCLSCGKIDDNTVICWMVGSHKEIERGARDTTTKAWSK
jgi:mRNA-degrading endonuclease RelE of RelBE toxin-antitoxin system